MRLPADKVRLISFVAAVILALPLSLGAWTGLYIWTSPFLLLNKLLSGQAIVVLNGLAVLVFAVIAIYPRWYCKWLCPTGVICDAVSGKRKKKIKLSRIPEFGRIILLASVVTVFGVSLFSYFLQVPMPILTWRGEF